jgi:hypothetical protein
MYNYTIIYYVTLALKFIGTIYYYFSYKTPEKITPGEPSSKYCRYCGYISVNILSCGCRAHISCLASRGYSDKCIYCGNDILLSDTDKRLFIEIYKNRE